MAAVRSLAAAVIGGFGAVAVMAALRAAPPGGPERWNRTNYAGRQVSLLGGAAVAAGATAGAVVAGPGALAGVIAGAAGGGFGAVDDLTESADGRSKGFRGHVGALAKGRLTTGGIKLLGISAASMVAAALATRGGRGASRGARVADVVASGALVAGTANVINLLDLRPGRALKSVVLVTAPVALLGGPAAPVAAATCGAAVAALPGDLGERTMLGDTGANALGALAGTALVLIPSRAVRAGALAGVVGLTVASEKVSFSQVIERTPILRRLDGWGRAPR